MTKPHVLLCKRSGNLLEAYKVWLQPPMTEVSDGIYAKVWAVCYDEHAGWIVNNPLSHAGMGPFFVFVNRKYAEKYLEDLGEL